MSKEGALCLKYNFLANEALNRNEVTEAIDYYDKAIATGYVDQQGVLLVNTFFFVYFSSFFFFSFFFCCDCAAIWGKCNTPYDNTC